MEQYPAIQAAANAPPAIDSICPQLPPEEPESSFVFEPDPASPLTVAETEPPLPQGEVEPPPQQPDPIPSTGANLELGEPLFGSGLGESPVLSPQASFDLPAVPGSPTEIPIEAALQQFSASMLPTEPDKEIPMIETVIPAEAQPLISEPPPVETPIQPQPEQVQRPVSASRYRRIPRPSYRTAVVLLSLLMIAVAGYIVLGTEAAASARKAWNIHIPGSVAFLQTFNPRHWGQSARQKTIDAGAQSAKASQDQNPSDILMNEVRALASENRTEESRVLLRRILETNPTYAPALGALKELEAPAKTIDRSVEESVSRISVLLGSGKLQLAKNEIDRLQQIHPEAAEIPALRRRLQALSSKQVQEQNRKEEERQKTLLKQKEDEWNRQLSEFFSQGKYGEAAGALSLWLTENPGSVHAQDMNARIQEIQRHLKAYSSAMGENRYPEALNALSSAEKLNPYDSNLTEMRRQTEARKAAARGTLTVHRLGAKATLLLDGKPVGKDGELESEPVSIGSHTLAIENGAGVIASRIQDYSEGQRVVLAYDLLKQSLRAMTDFDRDTLAQRRAMENVERFPLEHDHGVFRGSCRGILSLNFLDIAYIPSSGSHGFRIPFKLLKLRTDGKIASLYYISDNSHFQTFRFQDSQIADKFRQKWDELKAIPR